MGRNAAIDSLRGALILLVIGGHLLEVQGLLPMINWVGAGFRMPLVIGLSGFLIHADRLRAADGATMVSRYGRRLLLPWAIAMLAFVVAGQWPVSWHLPFDLLLRTPYHLWYIPVLCALIVMVRVIPLAPIQLLALTAPASVATIYIFGLDHAAIGGSILAPDSRYFRFMIYFFFGMAVARAPLPARWNWLPPLVGLLGLLWWISLYAAHDRWAETAARLLMNLGFIAMLPQLHGTMKLPLLDVVGRNSLFFYLWHPLPIGVGLALGLGGWSTLAATGVVMGLAFAMLRSWPGAWILGIIPRPSSPAMLPPTMGYSAG